VADRPAGGPAELTPDLTAAAAADPRFCEGARAWLRWGIGSAGADEAWHDPSSGVLGVVRRRRAYGSGLVVVGPDAAAGEVVGAVGRLAMQADIDFVTVERGPVADALRADWPDLPEAADWDWMWTQVSPAPVRGQDRVVPLGEADHAAVTGLLAVASPRHSAVPGEAAVRRWVGVRDAVGGLLACGADYEAVPGVPLLASIAVAPAARGQGLGAAVTAALTRLAFAAGTPAVTIDLYADNHGAHRLYEGLGFRTGLRLSSFRLAGADARRTG
jgi:ribosomal protein S18 acetylase RimI-like enzyme